jgi:hypothetical protein
MTAELRLWEHYSREDVHAVFGADVPFTRGAGAWGISGIVRVPETDDSYIFFVTYGRSQGDHNFVESITDEGVLTWQSQPQQRIGQPLVQKLIHQQELQSSIHLFLRTDAKSDYLYFGLLSYITHDEEREQPVHFKWQLLDWPPPIEVAEALDVRPQALGAPTQSEPDRPSLDRPRELLTERPPPAVRPPRASTHQEFQARKRAFYPNHDALNKELGDAGEMLVLQAERKRLIEAGRADLARQVRHVAVVEGDGAGYDIKSFAEDGEVRHLEVKSTRGAATTAFFISPNEVRFSEAHPSSFELVRVYDFDPSTMIGSCYRVPGPIRDSFALSESQFQAALLPPRTENLR